MKRAIAPLSASLVIAITAAGCSLLVDLTNLGDAGPNDAAVEACTLGINKLQNECANTPDATTTCVGSDGGISCVASPSECSGVYEQCGSPAECKGSCCVVTTFEVGCPATALDVKGTVCQAAGCASNSYQICTQTSECLPKSCIPIRFVSDASPIALSGGVCY